MHKKISEMPREWPLARKGKTYLAVASHDGDKGMPIVFAIRDMLKIADTRREVRKICLEGSVKINGKVRKDPAFPIQPRDILQLEKLGKNYKLILVNKKFKLEEVSPKETKSKTVKIVGKKIIGKNIVQANLEDGKNFITKDKFSCGDSAIVDFEKNQIVKIISLSKGNTVEVVKGKHIGSKGKIVGDKQKGEEIILEIKMGDGSLVCLDKNILLAIE